MSKVTSKNIIVRIRCSPLTSNIHANTGPPDHSLWLGLQVHTMYRQRNVGRSIKQPHPSKGGLSLAEVCESSDQVQD